MSEQTQPETDEQRIADRELLEIEQRCAQATPGPWSVETPRGIDTQWLYIVAGPDGDEILHAEAQLHLGAVHLSCTEHQREITRQHIVNLQFVAAARMDIPRLISQLRSARKERDSIKALLDARTGGREQ